jgi:TRAP-type C4-dicarboxylate transport system substrate-binding protein
LKKLLFITVAAILVLSVALIGCSGEATEYTLTIAVSGDGSVTDPGEGSFTYAPGAVVDLVATPDPDNYFVNWTGDVATVASVTNNVTTITMNGDYDIVANFQGPWTGTITLSFHDTVNPMASIWTKVQQPWIWAVQNATGAHGGNIVFDPITFGETPYAADDSLTALGAGVVDVGQLSGDTFKLGTIGYIPGLFTMQDQAYALATVFADDEVGDWDVLGELEDVHMLLATPLWPNQWFGTLNFTQLSDLSGKDVRAEGGEVAVVDALGANPIEIGTGDIGSALNLGLIDGCFFTWSAATIGGILDYSTYCTQVDFFPRAYFLAMNKDVYNGLHPEARALLDSLCTVQDSVDWAVNHYNGQGFLKGQCIAATDFHVMGSTEKDEILAACADVGPDWIDYMEGLGFDGQGFYDRVVELIDEYTP